MWKLLKYLLKKLDRKGVKGKIVVIDGKEYRIVALPYGKIPDGLKDSFSSSKKPK